MALHVISPPRNNQLAFGVKQTSSQARQWSFGVESFSPQEEISMSVFKLPLSGDVTQWISPITSWWSGNNISINLGESGSAETEVEILRRVGSSERFVIYHRNF